MGASATDQIAALTQEVQDTEGVLDSATTFINGVAAMITSAVQAALANGATNAQLQPLSDLGAAMKAKADQTAAAIAANQPPPPAQQDTPPPSGT